MKNGDNVRVRSDGRYEARYIKARDESGKIIYGCCYGKTYAEAVEKREYMLGRERKPKELNLLILGAGDHGQETYELAQSLRVFSKIAFLDDDTTLTNTLGTCEAPERFLDEYPAAIPAVGDEATRKRFMTRLADKGFVIPTLIHPSAVVSSNAVIGAGTVVCARATIGTNAHIGCGCIISSGATIDRHITLPDWSYVDCGQTVDARTDIETLVLNRRG